MKDEVIANPAPNVDEEVKGPDPAVWGDDSDRPSSVPVFSTSAVDEDGEPIEVKGPDPKVWKA